MRKSDITKTKLSSKDLLTQYQRKHQQQRVGGGHGRLLFAVDATASRAETWKLASELQAEMLLSVARDALDLKVAFYRGNKFMKTGWTSDGERLAQAMATIKCIGGYTQIKAVLKHALEENAKEHINAVVFIGDAMEEKIDELCGLASELAAAQVPVFVFHEHDDAAGVDEMFCGDQNQKLDVDDEPANTFRQIAEQSGGQYFKFDTNSPAAIKKFADTLNAVAALAIGDASAMAAIGYNKGGTK